MASRQLPILAEASVSPQPLWGGDFSPPPALGVLEFRAASSGPERSRPPTALSSAVCVGDWITSRWHRRQAKSSVGARAAGVYDEVIGFSTATVARHGFGFRPVAARSTTPPLHQMSVSWCATGSSAARRCRTCSPGGIRASARPRRQLDAAANRAPLSWILALLQCFNGRGEWSPLLRRRKSG